MSIQSAQSPPMLYVLFPNSLIKDVNFYEILVIWWAKFWLAFTYDLLGDKRLNDVIVNNILHIFYH